MSKLLLNEEPLLIMPKLATKIGLNESIILQQFHYWLLLNEKVKNNFNDGHYWTYNSYNEWKEQFPFWSVKTIQRTIKNLQDLKLVIASNYNKMKIDRTKWYRIDYEVLEILETSPFGQIDLTNRTEWLNHLDRMTKPIPETTTEISKEITKDIYINFPIDEHSYFFIYNKWFMDKFNKPHMRLRQQQYIDLGNWITDLEENFVDSEIFEDAVKEHFKNLASNNNGNMLAFMKASFRYFELAVENEVKNPPKKKSVKGNFNNFPQRNYNFNKLEKGLLGQENINIEDMQEG